MGVLIPIVLFCVVAGVWGLPVAIGAVALLLLAGFVLRLMV